MSGEVYGDWPIPAGGCTGLGLLYTAHIYTEVDVETTDLKPRARQPFFPIRFFLFQGFSLSFFFNFRVFDINVQKKRLAISGHAECQAFLEPTILASVAVDAIDDAILLARALVVDDGTLRPPEEALAAFTGDDSIVDARTLVAAHLARDDLDLRCKKKKYKIFF